MGHRIYMPSGSGRPAIEVVLDDAAPGIRIKHEGTAGNALEIVGPAGQILWSIDRAGTPSSGGGGGVSTQTRTQTITTDVNTFVASYIFDLGRVAPFYIGSTIVANNPDGETWGTGVGQIAVDVEAYEVSRDGVTWKGLQTSDWFHDVVDAPGVARFDTRGITARFIRVKNLRILDSNFNVYSGTHHPTVTAQFDVEYI